MAAGMKRSRRHFEAASGDEDDSEDKIFPSFTCGFCHKTLKLISKPSRGAVIKLHWLRDCRYSSALRPSNESNIGPLMPGKIEKCSCSMLIWEHCKASRAKHFSDECPHNTRENSSSTTSSNTSSTNDRTDAQEEEEEDDDDQPVLKKLKEENSKTPPRQLTYAEQCHADYLFAVMATKEVSLKTVYSPAFQQFCKTLCPTWVTPDYNRLQELIAYHNLSANADNNIPSGI